MTEYVYAVVAQFGEDGDLSVYTCRTAELAKHIAQLLLDAACRDIQAETIVIMWRGDDEGWSPDQPTREKLHETFDLDWTLLIERCEVLENLDFLKSLKKKAA